MKLSINTLLKIANAIRFFSAMLARIMPFVFPLLVAGAIFSAAPTAPAAEKAVWGASVVMVSAILAHLGAVMALAAAGLAQDEAVANHHERVAKDALILYVVALAVTVAAGTARGPVI